MNTEPTKLANATEPPRRTHLVELDGQWYVVHRIGRDITHAFRAPAGCGGGDSFDEIVKWPEIEDWPEGLNGACDADLAAWDALDSYDGPDDTV